MTTPPPRLAVHDALGRRVVVLDRPLFTIGRRAGHDLQLAGAEVSRDHAEIVVTSRGAVIRDRGSRYGTFVNGERVSERELAGGDRIECGRSGAALVFLTGDEGSVEDAPALGAGDLRQVATLLDALRQMGTNRVLDEVLVLVLDAAIDATGAERGFIMLPGSAGTLELTLARAAGHAPLPVEGFHTSRRIPEEVFASGETRVVSDLMEGDLAVVHTGTVALGIRHVLCAPLRLVRYVEQATAQDDRRSIGVLYLDSREKGRLFSVPARTALEALAAEAAQAIENARLYQGAIDKERLDQELAVASRIQQALLPEGRRTGPFFDAVGASVASRTIGGDFFDYQGLADGRFGFALGDVTGKGPAAALLTALVQGVLATKALTDAEPDEVVALVNRILLSRRIDSRYLTLVLGVLTPAGKLTYCNAAHNPPLVFGHTGVRRLEAGGTLVGAFADAAYVRDEVQLAKGDTVVLFSDGVSEAMRGDEEFGEARVRSVVEASLTRSPGQILAALFAAVAAFTGPKVEHDDLTALVVRYL